MRCIMSVSLTAHINNNLSPLFSPGRGLRQGLLTLLEAEMHNYHLLGLCASRYGPQVNHLLFADDCMVFIRNKTTEVDYLRQALHTYASFSGQTINFEKSTIFFQPRLSTTVWDSMNAILRVRQVDDPGVYLRVPLLVGKIKLHPLVS
ncbi:hypothetical protein GQ457_13G016130 [Hibiscus cannabinus]